MKGARGLILLSGILLSYGPGAGAQKSARDNTQKEKKGRITFESKSGAASRPGSSGEEIVQGHKNAVSVGLLSAALHGFLPVYLEHSLGDAASIQLGAGPTWHAISNDIGEKFRARTGSSDPGYTDDYTNYSHRKAAPGFMVSISPRFYTGYSDLLDGRFAGFSFEYKRYNFKAQKADESVNSNSAAANVDGLAFTPETVREHLQCLDVLIIRGGHHTMPNKLVLQWSYGIGLRFDKSLRLDVDEDRSRLSGNYVVNNTWEASKVRGLLQFNCGIGRAL